MSLARPKLAGLTRRSDPPMIVCAAADCGEHGRWGGEMGAFCVHHAPRAYFPDGVRPAPRPRDARSRWPGNGTDAAREMCRRWRKAVSDSSKEEAGRLLP
jgi:hypothetical protein